MKMSIFVRGLWGDQYPSPHAKTPQETGLGKNQIEILNTWTNFPQPEPCVNFVSGKHNVELLARHGIPFVEIDETPVQPGGSQWKRKFELCERAMGMAYEIVWLDWDCRMVRPLPGNFWNRLRDGQAFQAKLHWYRKGLCRFRPLRRSPHPMVVPHGACIYFRDLNLIRQALSLYSQHRNFSDEVIMALLYRDMTGKWIVPDEFAALGFDFPFLTTKRIFTLPRDVIFACGTFYEAVAAANQRR